MTLPRGTEWTPSPSIHSFFFFFSFLESILRRPRRPLSSSSCVAHHQLPSACQDTLRKGYFEFHARAQPWGSRLFAFTEGHELPDTCQPLFTPHTQVSIIYHQTQMSTVASSSAAVRSNSRPGCRAGAICPSDALQLPSVNKRSKSDPQ